MAKRNTMIIRAPKDVISNLRIKFPNVSDSNLIRMMYNTSLLKAEIKLNDIDFKNKLGRFLYGNVWKK